MAVLSELRSLTRPQRAAVVASFLGWTLDAFDFFILTFLLSNIAGEFQTDVKNVAYGITLTLALRPVGAFVFGYFADRFGRKPTLMVDVLLFSILEFASAFAPNLTVLLILRALFGFAMGGEWGIGSSLAMESIPAGTRGAISGLLQEGYAVGFLLAALANGLLIGLIGWRGMFVVGALPALLVLYIRSGVDESPVWKNRTHTTSGMLKSIQVNWKLFVYVIVLMSCFNAFSHGTQDLYANFLKLQHGFSPGLVSTLVIIGNVGAIVGGLTFGAWSERIGRRRAILIAALLCLPFIPIWAFGQTPVLLALGAFLIQVSVQGAWGIVPAHLNELSPPEVRGTFPGFTYQLGNFVISLLAPYQVALAEARGGNYGFALAATAGVVAVLIAVVVSFGPERRGLSLTSDAPAEPPPNLARAA
jgi:SHS family lactate transporter-like MFS transporter